MAFQTCLYGFKHHGKGPVDHCDRYQHLHVLECLLAQRPSEKHKLPDADDRHERTVLEHGNEHIAGRGDDDGHGLRQYYSPHGRSECKAQGSGGLPLTAWNTFYTATKDLRHVRAVVERECQDASRHGINHIAHLWQTKVDEVKQQQQRERAEQRRVEIGNSESKTVTRKLGNRAGQRAYERKNNGYRRHIDRCEEAFGYKEPKLFLDEFQAEVEYVEAAHKESRELYPDDKGLDRRRQKSNQNNIQGKEKSEHKGDGEAAVKAARRRIADHRCEEVAKDCVGKIEGKEDHKCNTEEKTYELRFVNKFFLNYCINVHLCTPRSCQHMTFHLIRAQVIWRSLCNRNCTTS